MTKILEDLKWDTLEKRRKVQRLTLLYKAVHGFIHIPLPGYLERPNRVDRGHHSHHFIQLGSQTNQYQHSFSPRTVAAWNSLPPDIVAHLDAASFKKAVVAHL